MVALTRIIVFSRNIRFFSVSSFKLSFCKGPWNILFFGTDQFAVKPLDYLNSLRVSGTFINNIEVVCPPEKRRQKDIIKQQSKNATVRQFAEMVGLTIHNWPLDRKNLEFLSRFHLGIVVSFGHFIPSWIINCLLCEAINVHPSLLPKWRGPAPIFHTMLNGDTETGVSVIEVSSKKFDAGKILLQKRIQITPDKSYEDLEEQLSILSSQMLVEVLTNFPRYKMSAVAQNNSMATKAPKMSKEIGYLRWKEFSCEYIERLWRVVGHKFGLKCKWDEKVVNLEAFIEAAPSLSAAPDGARYGQPFYDSCKNVLYIKCKDGWVGWSALKVQYRQTITAKEFSNGYLLDKDTGKETSTVFHDMT